MSVVAVTHLAGKASSSSDAAAAKGKPDAHTVFAAAIAGADPVARSAGTPHPSKAGDKAQRARHADDAARDEDDPVAAADGSTPITVPPPATAAGATPTKSATPAAEGSRRVASRSDAAAVPANDPAAIDLTQTAADVTDSTLAPILAALADTAAATQACDQPPVPATAPPASTVGTTAAAAAAPATAALMASRVTPPNTPFSGRADARVSAASHKSNDDADASADADADPAAAAIDPTTTGATTALSLATNVTVAADAHASAAEGAAGQLATGGADRQLDLAKQGAWLDGIAHDIAATGIGDGSLRFAVAPQHLGAVQVEMMRGGDGATVTLTASSEAGRIALADARPQLIADARAQGIHIASAQVDLGSGQTGADSRQPSSGQDEPRSSSHGSSADQSFSAQANAQGGSGRQSQTRSQPLAANPVSTSGSPDAEAAPAPADGLYA